MAYNGWKNYETWNVALWLGNDEPLYRIARERAAAGRMSGKDAESFVREVMPSGTPDFHDMGRAKAYARVHWPSIAGWFNEP